MHKVTAITVIAAAGLGLHTTAHAYGTTANVTFSWATAGTDIGWTAQGTNTLAAAAVTNSNYFSSTAGFNSVGFYNSDFATVAGCAAAVADPSNTVGWDGTAITTRKYGCRDASSSFIPSAITGSGPKRAMSVAAMEFTDPANALVMVYVPPAPPFGHQRVPLGKSIHPAPVI